MIRDRLRSFIGGHALEAVVLFAIGFTVLCTFGPVVRFDFVRWDDDIAIVQNPHILQLDWANLRWMLTDCSLALRYIPLSWINRALLCKLFGLDPSWFHLESLLIHLANSILAFFLLRRLLFLSPDGRARESVPAATLGAGLAALLWAVHPLRVEVVAWVTQEHYAQAVFFFMIALLSYLRAATGEGGPRRRAFYWIAVGASAASVLSYPIGALLVGLLVVLDVYPLGRLEAGPGRWWSPHARSIWLEKIPFALVPASAAAITIWIRLHPAGLWQPPVPLSAFGLLARTMQAFYIWAYYVWRPWFPIGLCPVYSRLIGFVSTEPVFLGSVGLVLAITAGAVLVRRRFPLIHAVWACHLVLLVPVLGVLEKPHFSSDRYSYLQGLCWSVLLAAALVAVWRWNSRPLAAAACLAAGALVLCLAFMARQQTLIWADSVGLFSSIIDTMGEDASMLEIPTRLGIAHLTRGQSGDDEKALEILLAHPPPIADLLDAGWIYLRTNQPDKAVALFRKGLSIEETPDLRNGLGVALLAMGNRGAAEREFTRTLRLTPRYVDALINLGLVSLQRHDPGTAIERLTDALKLAPDNPEAKRLLEEARTARDRAP